MKLIKYLKSKEDLIIYTPASEFIIEKAQRELNLCFAEEYKKYISKFGFAIFEDHELSGICDGKRLDVTRLTQGEKKINTFVPDDWYVLETLDIDGIVIWQNQKGEIFQTMPNGYIEKLSNSICEYLQGN